jgi:hypothetical protein
MYRTLYREIFGEDLPRVMNLLDIIMKFPDNYTESSDIINCLNCTHYNGYNSVRCEYYFIPNERGLNNPLFFFKAIMSGDGSILFYYVLYFILLLILFSVLMLIH